MITSRLVPFIIVVAITTVFATALFTQGTNLGIPQIVSFTKEAYRGGTQNWGAVQDDGGMMVFANNKGVLLHDGTHWDLLALPNHTIVRSVAKAGDGKIFVGGQGEFGYLTKDTQRGVAYRSLSEQLPVQYANFEDVWNIFTTPTRTYFCTHRAIFVYVNGTFSVVTPEKRFQDFFFVNEKLYAQEEGRGLLHWQNDRLEPMTAGGLLKGTPIADILTWPDGLLIVSASAGLFQWTEGKLRAWETEVSSLLRQNLAFCAVRLPDDNIAIGTAQNGLVVIDTAGKALLHLNKETGLQNNTVLAIGLDRLRNYWLALDNGIDYVQVSAPFTRISDEVGLPGTGYAVARHGGRLYLGTNQGLFETEWPLLYQDQLRNRLRKVEALSGQVWGFSKLGDALIVNMHTGSFQLETQEKIVPLSPGRGSWKMMALPGRPDFAIEGGYAGLSLYERTATPAGNDQWRYRGAIAGFDESARVMEIAPDGDIWVSHAYKGLFRLRLDENFRLAEAKHFGEDDGLPDDLFIDVTKIKEEVVFITPAGIYHYEEATQRFKPYDSFNTLFDGPRDVHYLAEDVNNQLWFSMDQTFGFFDIRASGFLARPKIEQLYFNHLQDELVDGFEVVQALDDKHTMIGTERGFIAYTPRPEVERDAQLNVLLREVRTGNAIDSVLYTERLRFGEDTLRVRQELVSQLNALTFSYAAPFYEHQGQLEYRHWLQGYETHWSAWSKRTEKEYTNLAPGTYAFVVQAKNAYGVVSASREYAFEILPPWYLSVWAKVAYVFIGLCTLAAAFRSFSRKLEKERAELAQRQARDMAEVAEEFRQEQEKSEEEIARLRNEKLESDIQHRNAQLASSTMHLVQKGEVLLKIKKELTKVIKQSATEENRRKLQKIIHTIDGATRLDSNWEQFEAYFDQVHENFLHNLRTAYPDLTPKDQKLCAYLRMNLTTKEIAPLMNISVRGVEISRYRLRKKLDLDTAINLTDFIMRF